MSNEIQLYDRMQSPIEAIEKIGAIIAKSGFAGCERIEQGQLLALMCMSERKSITALLRTYHIVDGRLSKKAGAAIAEFLGSGGKIQWLKTGDEYQWKIDRSNGKLEWPCEPFEWAAQARVTNKAGELLTVRYSMHDAQIEGVLKPKSRYEKRAGQMLRARVITNALGILAPEIFAGESEGDMPEPAQLDLAKQQIEQPNISQVEQQSKASVESKIESQAEAKAGLAPASDGLLDEALATKVGAVIKLGVNGEEKLTRRAIEWMLVNKKLTQDEALSATPLRHLNIKFATAIIERPERFLSAINRGVK